MPPTLNVFPSARQALGNLFWEAGPPETGRALGLLGPVPGPPGTVPRRCGPEGAFAVGSTPTPSLPPGVFLPCCPPRWSPAPDTSERERGGASAAA